MKPTSRRSPPAVFDEVVEVELIQAKAVQSEWKKVVHLASLPQSPLYLSITFLSFLTSLTVFHHFLIFALDLLLRLGPLGVMVDDVDGDGDTRAQKQLVGAGVQAGDKYSWIDSSFTKIVPFFHPLFFS